MVVRPWVTPKEIRDYSSNKDVKNRTDIQLSVDITRAEQYVISRTNNDFSEYEAVPQNVKTAVILLAESYGYNSAVLSRNLKSETLDDYSYTVENKEIDLSELDVSYLLKDYVKVKPKNGITMRMRRL